MIKLQVIGHLGKDCTVNNVSGKNVINFNVAHSEKYKDNMGVQQEKTQWVECAYWTERTNIAQYLKKGTQVYADGNAELRSYQTQDGKQGVSLTLRVISVQLLGTKGGGEANMGAEQSAPVSNYNRPFVQSATQSTGSQHEITEPADDLPF